MKYITFENPRGRSAHALKHIMSAYIISMLSEEDVEVLPGPGWNKQKIINFKTKHNQQPALSIKNKSIKGNWDGMPLNDVKKVLTDIQRMPDNCMFVLTGIQRVHPFQLSYWFENSLIKNDIFSQSFIPKIRELYFSNKTKETTDCLSVHVRRGDIARKTNPHHKNRREDYSMFWDISYLEKNIQKFRQKFPETQINIFSETRNSKDVQRFAQKHNLNLKLGNSRTLEKDFHQMVSSKFFMPCNSGISTWASYISEGTKIFENKKTPTKIKHFHKNLNEFTFLND